MAAVAAGTRETDIKEFGRFVDVSDAPQAKLMYYLDSMCHVLDLTDQANLRKLRDYRNYRRLTEAEVDTLVALCFMLSPDELNNKVIFQDDALCKGGLNNFYKIDQLSKHLLISENIVIGGQTRRVLKIMAYTRYWMNENWVDPMKHFAPRLARIATGRPSTAQPQSLPAVAAQAQPRPVSAQRPSAQRSAQRPSAQRPRSSDSWCSIS